MTKAMPNELLIAWDDITLKLRESGVDLSKVLIVSLNAVEHEQPKKNKTVRCK